MKPSSTVLPGPRSPSGSPARMADRTPRLRCGPGTADPGGLAMFDPPARRRNGRVWVLGAGRSGVAAARLLLRRGFRVTLLDEAAATSAAADTLASLAGAGDARFRKTLPPVRGSLGGVISPGFPPGHAWVRALRAAGIPCLSEIELAARCWTGGVLAVTGSKGKSSVVKLCAEALRRSGRAAVACGNYGRPWSAAVLAHPAHDWAVVEVSSFQLDHSWDWRPDVAVLLNVLPDHLDRHGTMRAYRNVKFRLFSRQRAGDAAVLPRGMRAAGHVPEAVRRIRFGTAAGADWRYDAGGLTGRRPRGAWVTLNIEGTPFDNPVWGVSAAAAAAALEPCGVTRTAIEAAFRNYRSLPHRMEVVLRHAGVTFINDSKATSLSALAAALRMTPGPVRLIAGGRLKEKHAGFIKEMLAKRVRRVYLIGESASGLAAAWSAVVRCEIVHVLERAVERAWAQAEAGEVVLFSPGCASFDQFKNFEQRGERYAVLVRTRIPSGTSCQRRMES